MEIVEEKENKLLNRVEYVAKLSYAAETPSREAIKDKLSDLKKTDRDLIALRKIDTHFGTRDADVIFYIYNSKEDMDKFEPVKLQKLKKQEKAAKKAEEAQKPKEEPKVEPKTEEKAETKEEPAEKKEAPKDDAKDEAKEDSKEDKKEEVKEEKAEKPAEENKGSKESE